MIDTPLVRKAWALVEANFEPPLVRHMYRSWLFGAPAINNNATLAAEIDLEAQAVVTTYCTIAAGISALIRLGGQGECMIDVYLGGLVLRVTAR
jgi:hypothetical protein